jgi:hypothetical protein
MHEILYLIFSVILNLYADARKLNLVGQSKVTNINPSFKKKNKDFKLKIK